MVFIEIVPFPAATTLSGEKERINANEEWPLISSRVQLQDRRPGELACL
jgi:hypothetical protein